MRYLKLQNKGELDIRLISLMGGTTKRGNDYKIGRFGSGLKYSLAWLIRNNVDFKIFIGEKQIPISTKSEDIQGTVFDVLYIDGERTSISSSLGVDWEAWMIVRELFCNALDEGEYVKEVTDMLAGEQGCTTFYVQLIDGIKETVDNWSSYFVHDVKPLYDTEKFAVYPAQSQLCLYKNGVLIHKDKEFKSLFSYDIKNADINELREYKGYLTYDLNECVKKLDVRTAELFMSTIKETHFEYDMDYSYFSDFAPSWKEAIGEGKIIAIEDLKTFKERGIHIDEAKLIPLPKNLFAKLAQRFEGISAVRRADKVNSFYETFDSDLQLKISSALAILETCNYEVHPELKFIYGEFGDATVFARINKDTKEVMFSTQLKLKPMFEIVACIIEECEHFRTGFQDCSRGFQTHFIHLFTREMMQRNSIQV